jgi:hypothetical protein
VAERGTGRRLSHQSGVAYRVHVDPEALLVQGSKGPRHGPKAHLVSVVGVVDLEHVHGLLVVVQRVQQLTAKLEHLPREVSTRSVMSTRQPNATQTAPRIQKVSGRCPMSAKGEWLSQPGRIAG